MSYFTPRPYQDIGRGHLLDTPRAALWAGMGMGKTLTVLEYVDILRLSGEGGPVLVVAPVRVARDTWLDEAARWENLRHLRVSAVLGNAARRAAALRVHADIYTTNYENLPWLQAHLGDNWPFRTVIADEATQLKGLRVSLQVSKTGKRWLQANGGSTRAAALAKVAFKHVDRVVQLTGTPSPNGLQDLWGQLWFLDGGERLGRTYSAFAERWFYPDRSGYGIVPRAHAQAEIEAAVKDICLTLRPKDWFDLREPLRSTVRVTLPESARKAYREMERKMYVELDGVGVKAVSAAAKTVKCLQIANGALYTDEAATEWAGIHNAKIDALHSVVEEAAGAPVLCAYQFKHDLARLLKAFPRGVDIGTPRGMAAFKAGSAAIGFGHPGGVGHGVDGLQHVCNIVAFFGHWWATDAREQFIARVGPMRQAQAALDRAVFVYDIVAVNTIDEIVMLRHETKISIQDALLQVCNRNAV